MILFCPMPFALHIPMAPKNADLLLLDSIVIPVTVMAVTKKDLFHEIL